jgi:hypothetical protein
VGSYFEVNLETGAIVVTEEDLSLETAHGIIMFIAWSVLCVIGIFASSFRDLWPWPQHKKTYWFSVHKAVQISVVVLTLIGFAISVHMTEDAGMPHFDSLHQQLGLTMAIIAVIQPLNALIRPKPTVLIGLLLIIDTTLCVCLLMESVSMFCLNLCSVPSLNVPDSNPESKLQCNSDSKFLILSIKGITLGLIAM